MRKRQLTTILLIWLLSQQLFASVWATPNADIACAEYSQSDCATLEPTTDLNNKSAEICDNCISPEPLCDGAMLACATGSPQCTSGMLGVLMTRQPSLQSHSSIVLPLTYDTSIYQDISIGITLRPPKPAV